jgi:glycerophosphoryl diester phosphodiesterase
MIGMMLRSLIAAVAVAALSAGAGAFDLQGHRGARGLAPENTLAAFERALEIGVTTLETDVHLSSDGLLVLSHDPRINADLARDAQGTWVKAPGPLLRDLTLSQIQAYGHAAVHVVQLFQAVVQLFQEQADAEGLEVGGPSSHCSGTPAAVCRPGQEGLAAVQAVSSV